MTCDLTCETSETTTGRECCIRQQQNTEALRQHLQSSEHREHCARGACTATD